MVEEEHTQYTLPKQIVATIGAFDGVHRGHLHVIQTLISKAKEEGHESAVITFSPHPRLVMEGERSNLTLINTLQEQKRQLSKCGVDQVIHLAFNKKLQSLTAREFIEQVLISELNISTLLVGYNHHIGCDRVLACDLIEEYQDIAIVPLERLDVESSKVSSTIIRKEIATGSISKANTLLGYNYTIIAKIDPYGNIIDLCNRKIVPPNGRYKALFNEMDIVLDITDNNLKILQILPDCVDYNRFHIFEIIDKID